MRPAKIAAVSLNPDRNFWPRHGLDTANIRGLAQAYEMGAPIPPVTAERKSRRIVDGFHRQEAVLKAFGPDAEIDVFWKTYKSDAEMFEDAVRLNATHGRKLSTWDVARIAIRADELNIKPEQIAAVLNRPPEWMQRLRNNRQARLKNERVALKRPLAHLAGQQLTEQQEAWNEKASGWSSAFHANQLLLALENDGGTDMSDHFAQTLLRLRELIDELRLEDRHDEAAA